MAYSYYRNYSISNNQNIGKKILKFHMKLKLNKMAQKFSKGKEKFERYYKSQLGLTEDEFSHFVATCEKPLPLTFRFTSTFNKKPTYLKNEFLTKYNTFFESRGIPSNPIKFYPNELAWQIDMDKNSVKKDEHYKKFHKFLMIETDCGDLNRQEAVSMIPPLVLDVQPEHKVLDMCAAPGSKTAQLVESIHQIENPTGFVMANDSDFKRGYMLAHQIKRFNSLNTIVTHHDAKIFPNLKLNNKFVKFDRILCDVPCSGDGTMRKNAEVWKKWSVKDSFDLHNLQYKILSKGLSLLKKNGRLVYSTCSMNPIENEAVVLRVLKENLNVRIKKVELPGLAHSKGLTDWKVLSFDFEEITKQTLGNKHFFPDAKYSESLENCIRVYPHQQNTGGFFITVLEKIEETEVENELKEIEAKEEKEEDLDELIRLTLSSINPKKHEKASKSNEYEYYKFLEPNDPELNHCFEYYGIEKTPKLIDSCFIRNDKGDLGKIIYLSDPTIKSILMENEKKLELINSGLKLFVSQRNTEVEMKYRVHNEAVDLVYPLLTSKNRTIVSDYESFKVLLVEKYPKYDQFENKEFVSKVKSVSQGCAFITLKLKNELELIYTIWISKNSTNLMLSDKEKHQILLRYYPESA